MATKDIVQNTFIKVHKHLYTLKDSKKVKSWLFQIARNELANYYKINAPYTSEKKSEYIQNFYTDTDFCCFERFLEELPESYKKVVKLVYLEGKTNSDAANELQLSLANVKAQIRRSKSFLKQRFQECCNYDINKSGKLIGKPDCVFCYSI